MTVLINLLRVLPSLRKGNIKPIVDFMPDTGKHVGIHSSYYGSSPGFQVINVRHFPLVNDILYKSQKIKISSDFTSGSLGGQGIAPPRPIHLSVNRLLDKL